MNNRNKAQQMQSSSRNKNTPVIKNVRGTSLPAIAPGSGRGGVVEN